MPNTPPVERSAPSARGIFRLDEVPARPVAWLWPGRVPLGKLTILDGDPGLGKSTLLLDLAARLTTARPMPDDPVDTQAPAPSSHPLTPSSILLISAEDAAADTVRPRLEAAGADLSRVFLWSHLPDALGGGLPELPRDVPWIDRLVGRFTPRLVLLDPLVAYLGRGVNPHSDQDVRRALAPLARLAEDRDLALVVVRHLAKRAARNPLYRGGGSIGLIGAARSGLLVARDPDDPSAARRILASLKSNLGPPPPSLAFRLVPSPNGAATLAWEGPSHHTPATLLAEPAPESTTRALDEAKTILTAILADGPLPAETARRQALQAGLALHTIRRAKLALGIRSHKLPDHWLWSLPTPSPQAAHDP